MNNSGIVAGYVSGTSGMQAATWATDGTVRLLGSLQTRQTSQARAIDLNGDVAGSMEKDGVSQAFLWTAKEGMNLLPGGASTKANGINDLGHVVGSCAGREGARACLWTSPTAIENLGTLPSGDHAEAFDINNEDIVVGAAGTSMGLRAFVWTRPDGMRDLNALIPATSGIILSAAVAINEKGEILAYGGVNHDLEQGSQRKFGSWCACRTDVCLPADPAPLNSANGRKTYIKMQSVFSQWMPHQRGNPVLIVAR